LKNKINDDQIWRILLDMGEGRFIKRLTLASWVSLTPAALFDCGLLLSEPLSAINVVHRTASS
jgi:hypothetical protein